MNRDALAWGLVGGLGYLVLLGGYQLASGWRASPLVWIGVACVVAAGTTVTSVVIDRRLRENGRA